MAQHSALSRSVFALLILSACLAVAASIALAGCGHPAGSTQPTFTIADQPTASLSTPSAETTPAPPTLTPVSPDRTPTYATFTPDPCKCRGF